MPPMHPDERNQRRRFGQNFLIDPAVIAGIVQDIGAGPGDHVIEIGPGNGALTRELLRTGARLTAVEIDPKWVGYLRERLPQVEVVQADARWIDVAALCAKDARPPLVAGNLPYNMAGPILRNFTAHLASLQRLHVMVQYEVAKRMTASPGGRDWGYLSVYIQNLATATLKRKIAPAAFRPAPRVHSATVELTAHPPVCTDPLFLAFARAAFTGRRKTLANSLSGAAPKAATLAALRDLGLSETARTEELSIEELVRLLNALRGVLTLPGVTGDDLEGSQDN